MLSLTNKSSLSPDKTEQQHWAQALKRWKLASFAAAFLESGGAFATLAAQSIYLAEPMLEIWAPRQRLDGFAQLLEDPQQTADFAALLREAE